MSGLLLDAGVLVACSVDPALYRQNHTMCDTSISASRHVLYSGRYRITGIVDIKGTPNVPVSRRVLLFDPRSRLVVAETWSDVVRGYAFDCLAAGNYDVITYDHTGNSRAVIADGVPADPMP